MVSFSCFCSERLVSVYVQRWEEKEFKSISNAVDFQLTRLNVSISFRQVTYSGENPIPKWISTNPKGNW